MIEQEIVNQRTVVCTSCEYFQENKCNMCGCPTLGIIDKLTSRCPMNKWEDGWGTNYNQVVETDVIYNSIPITAWNEEKQEIEIIGYTEAFIDTK